MIDEEIKEIYEWVLKNISLVNPMDVKKKYGLQKDVFFLKRLKCNDKLVKVDTKNTTFGFKLNDQADEEDYIEYVKYVALRFDLNINNIIEIMEKD